MGRGAVGVVMLILIEADFRQRRRQYDYGCYFEMPGDLLRPGCAAVALVG